MKLLNLIGRKFGKLTIISGPKRDNEKDITLWEATCECNSKPKWYRRESLIRGTTNSCGCIQNEIHSTHKMSHTHLYQIWKSIKQRIFNPNSNSYHNYGGRGIDCDPKYFEKDSGFVNFYNDIKTLGPKPSKNHSIDRKDNNKGYWIWNMRWATRKLQNNNRRIRSHYKGKPIKR